MFLPPVCCRKLPSWHSVYIDLAVLPVPAQLRVKQENALGSISLFFFFFSLKYSCTTTLQLDGNL